MNLNMIRPKNDTEFFLLSFSKNCGTRIKQTHRKAEETVEFSISKSRETLYFDPPISVEGSWLIGLPSLEAYNSIFNISEENIKFELYTDNFDEFSFSELKDELEEILSVSHSTQYHLQHDKVEPRNIQAYEKLRSEKSNTYGYIIQLMGYARSPIRDFESYFRIVVGLDEDDIQLILKQ